LSHKPQQPFPSSELDIELNKIDSCWHQGETAFKDAQKSAKKIFILLKMQYGSSFPTKHIVEKMRNKLGHLNGISDYEIRNLLRDDFLIE
jgi:hypothetical protein